MQKRYKIDVYLSKEHKEIIRKKADKFGLSISDYVKLKSLDILKEQDERQ